MATVMLVPATAFGSHDFTDVPDEHVFHSHISWLLDAGVTLGCNPPANDQYCPEDNVTRGQMAAFMKRLSEGNVVNAATAVTSDDATRAETAASADDAALLSGMSVDDLKTLTFSAVELGAGLGVFTSPEAVMMTLDFEVPVAGSILVTHSTSLGMGVDPTAIAVVPSLDGCDPIFFDLSTFAEVSSENRLANAAGVVPFAVDAGSHTISYCGSVEASDVFLINTQLGVVFEPGGVAPVIEPPPVITGDVADFWN